MARKGIAIPYIIALILGIVVVGVIGYWFFTTTGTGGASSSKSECQSKQVQWCSEWSSDGFSGSSPRSLGSWDTYASGCTDLGVTPNSVVCRVLTGTLKASGASCTLDGECQSRSCVSSTCPTGYTPVGGVCKKEGSPDVRITKACA